MLWVCFHSPVVPVQSGEVRVRKEQCGKCGERGHLQELCEAIRAYREWYVAGYGRAWEWIVNLVPNVEGERHRSRDHNRSPKGRRRSRSWSRSPRSGRSRSPRRDSRGQRESRDGGHGRDRDGDVAWERHHERGDHDRDYDREYHGDRHQGWEQHRDGGGCPEAGRPMAPPWH